jgi:hypothetical protein
MADGNEPGDEPPVKSPSGKYDQDFFLALAAKGKDEWNRWRRNPANEDVRVTFEGVDFSEPPRDQIDFSGFEFGTYANFSWCKWRGPRSKFTVFEPGRASFIGAAFGEKAIFGGAVFGWWATFDGATFGDSTRFDRAAFGYMASFDNTIFKGHVQFTGKPIEQLDRDFVQSVDGMDMKDKEVRIRIALKKRHEDSWTRFGYGPDRFLEISFEHARFDGEANFTRRTFEGVLMPQQMPPESISAASILVLFLPAASCIGLLNPKSQFDCAVFEN